jgi:protein-disulfide isomerase
LGISPGTAKVIVVKFNDWLCPMCKGMALAYQPVLDKYQKSDPGAVKVVLKDWPWNTDCNFKAGRTLPGHEGACSAAVAVRLARDHGKGDAMIDWIFSNQERLDQLGVSGAGAQASQMIRDQVATQLGIKDFDHEAGPKTVDIRRDVADGSALNVTSTPTFFINGVRIPDGQTLAPEYFDLAIQIELKKAGAKQ